MSASPFIQLTTSSENSPANKEKDNDNTPTKNNNEKHQVTEEKIFNLSRGKEFRRVGDLIGDCKVPFLRCVTTIPKNSPNSPVSGAVRLYSAIGKLLL